MNDFMFKGLKRTQEGLRSQLNRVLALHTGSSGFNPQSCMS